MPFFAADLSAIVEFEDGDEDTPIEGESKSSRNRSRK
jgi:hypothetical protein